MECLWNYPRGVDRQYHKEQNEGESTITFGFDSAWAPPIGAYEKFLAENSNVSIRTTYYEGGCDFMGIWDNGIDDCWTISDTAPKGSKDKFWDTGDGKILDDLYGITEYMTEYEESKRNEDAVKVKEAIVDKKAQNMEGA